jgi:hypothetical protein
MAQYSFYRPSAAEPWSAFDSCGARWTASSIASAVHRRGRVMGRGVFPAVNLYETVNADQWTVELPGVEPADIEVKRQRSHERFGRSARIVRPAAPSSIDRIAANESYPILSRLPVRSSARFAACRAR